MSGVPEMETEHHGFGYGYQSGVDGSRTRVQKPIPCPSTIIVRYPDGTFSRLFPPSVGNEQPSEIGSSLYVHMPEAQHMPFLTSLMPGF